MTPSSKTKWIITTVLLLAALAGTAIGLSSRQNFVAAYPDPGVTMTPIPRTPRPTRARATQTGTIAPTPTLDLSGVHVYNQATPGSCPTRLARADAEEWDVSWEGYIDAIFDHTSLICNFGPGEAPLCIDAWHALTGWSTSGNFATTCGAFCTPDIDGWVPTDTTSGTNNCNLGYHPPLYSSEGTTCFTLAGPEATPGAYTHAHFGATFGQAQGLGCEFNWNEGAWNIYGWPQTWDPNPDGNPTPQPSGGDGWITEILARPQGATCGDWNLRGGCGNNDQFVEVGVATPQSVAEYRLKVLDAGDQVVCVYTIAADNWTYPLKAFWQDYMVAPTPTGTPPATGTPVPCGQWPETGHVRLYDADGIEVDDREYNYVGGQAGDSWAAMNWTDPGGPWWWYSPSPGRGNRVPPTVTPTATSTWTPSPTPSPTPTATPT